MTPSIITLPHDARLELCLSADGDFLGIGGVAIGGTPLRSPQRPFSLRIDTPEGILYTRYRLLGITQLGDGGAEVALQAIGVSWGRGEYCDEYDQPLYWMELPTETVTDALTLLLNPATLELGGRAWTGFSYAFRYQSASRRIHRLLAHATWEIDGRITGNTVLTQGQCNMPVYHGAAETTFTTTCLKTLEQFGSPQGVSYQLAPRAGLLPAFDFQHADAGALFMYWPEFASISSVVESPAGSELLHVVDEYRFPLSGDVVTPAKHVLFTPGALVEHDARNLWHAAHEQVYGGIRAAYGIAPTVVKPEVGLRYSTRVTDDGLKMTVAGEEVASQEVPYAIADRVLPLLAARGITRFFPEVMSESDVTVVGLRRKLDGGVHGDLHCSSVCATHRFLPSEFWGGMKAWRYMADAARKLGIEIGAWFAFHYSPRAAIFEEHPEWRVIGANTLSVGGGYGPSTINVGDWHSGLYDWTLADISRWKEEGGLDYLFTDSWANMGLVQVNFTDAMRTNFDAEARLLADVQKLGITAFTFEGISPFGASRIGVADLRGDLLDAMGGIVGQNDFGWWRGQEDMACGMCLCLHDRKRTQEELQDIQFRLMANRGFAMLEGQYNVMYDMPDWWVRLNRIFTRALPHMRHRRLLPNGAGVLWEDGATQVLWAYADAAVELPAGAVVEEIEAEGTRPTGRVKAGGVYRIVGTFPTTGNKA